jgi:cytochrome oxidase assembly protein ShyY1
MMIELAPTAHQSILAGAPAIPVRQYRQADNRSVLKHKAYALQWFSMAVVFFLACLIVLLKSNTTNRHN